MKIRIVAGTFLGMMGLLCASLVFAQASNASRVGVINMQTAILESVEGRAPARQRLKRIPAGLVSRRGLRHRAHFEELRGGRVDSGAYPPRLR